MNGNIAISIKNLSKTFFVKEKSYSTIRDYVLRFYNLKNKRHTIQALDNISFEVKKGEILGIIGRNGSGKSTLLKIIIGAMIADPGSLIQTNGKIIRLSLGMGFDKNLSARDNVYINGSILGLTFKQIGRIFYEIIEFADLEEFVDTPIRFFSSGMVSRLAFSIAIHADADIYLMDEFFGGVGDENFKKKSDKIFEEAFLKGQTIILVSHSMETIKKHCDKVLLLNKGKQIMLGDPEEVVEKYLDIMKRKKIKNRKH